MQQSTLSPSSSPGELIASFHHGKGFLIFTLCMGIFMLGMALVVLYLGTVLPPTDTGPVEITTRRGTTLTFSSLMMMIYCSAAFLAFVGVAMLGIYVKQKKLRQPRYEVYEHGIAHFTGAQKDYVPFAEIEDLYLFGSGQAALSGLVTNLAFRRNADEPFHRVNESLKDFYDFQQRVRELHVRERLPVVLSTLQSGGAVTFRYIDNAKVWRRLISVSSMNVSIAPIVMTQNFLEVRGRKVPMSSLSALDLSAWAKKVVIKDETGKPLLSKAGTSILSHDLFLNTLEALQIGAKDRSELSEVPA